MCYIVHRDYIVDKVHIVLMDYIVHRGRGYNDHNDDSVHKAYRTYKVYNDYKDYNEIN